MLASDAEVAANLRLIVSKDDGADKLIEVMSNLAECNLGNSDGIREHRDYRQVRHT